MEVFKFLPFIDFFLRVICGKQLSCWILNIDKELLHFGLPYELWRSS